jgi:predicted AAA+ superfamily ATPase
MSNYKVLNDPNGALWYLSGIPIDTTMVLEYHSDMNAEVNQYLTEMLAQAPVSALEWMNQNTKSSGVQRRAYLVVSQHVSQFLAGRTSKEWIVMPGLRGTGKTTMLTQLYNSPSLARHQKFYLSLDKVKSVGGRMIDVITVIEASIGGKIEDSDSPIFLLLDEVQYLEDWALVLKTISDRAKSIFIVCTGSSAIMLQTNPDVARRSDVIKVHPLCFTEFVMMDQAHKPDGPNITYPPKGLPSALRDAIFNSSNASQVYAKLTTLSPAVQQYWRGLNRSDLIRKYMLYGTLPFTLTLPNETVIWARIYQTLSEVLARDVHAIGKFDQQTISNLPRLLFLLAHSEQISLNSLASTLGINIKTIRSVLDELESTEIITAIRPKGSSFGRITKPYKYLFTSPAMRYALVNSGGAIKIENDSSSMIRGQLLEDIVGMYLKRIFIDSQDKAIVEYDTAKGGADFILSLTGEKKDAIAIEVGVNKTSNRQAVQTLNDIGGKYGMVITDRPLSVDVEHGAVYVPLEYFLLT